MLLFLLLSKDQIGLERLWKWACLAMRACISLFLYQRMVRKLRADGTPNLLHNQVMSRLCQGKRVRMADAETTSAASNYQIVTHTPTPCAGFIGHKQHRILYVCVADAVWLACTSETSLTNILAKCTGQQ